jgi:hypothetical protein
LRLHHHSIIKIQTVKKKVVYSITIGTLAYLARPFIPFIFLAVLIEGYEGSAAMVINSKPDGERTILPFYPGI